MFFQILPQREKEGIYGKRFIRMKRNKPNSHVEVGRQLVHLFLGIAISFVVYYLVPIIGYFILLPLILALILLIVVPRIHPDLKIANHLLYHFERDHDILNFPFRGSIWYGIGIIAPILLLPLNVACAVIVILSVGDSTSTLIGKFFGRIRLGDKSLEGFLAFVFFGFISAMMFINNPILAILLAFFGGIIEFFTFMDDNFLVPTGLTIFYLILNILS